MKRDYSNLGAFTRIHPDIDIPVRSRILVIDELREWLGDGSGLPSGDLAFLEFDDLTTDILRSIRPDIVLVPLQTRVFDCVEVAQRLWEACYPGKLRAQAEGLPDPDIVRREVRAEFPGLDFDVVESPAEV